MRHPVARCAEILGGRIGEEVRDSARIDARIVLDLLAEARVVVALFEHAPPVRVVAALDLGRELIATRDHCADVAALAIELEAKLAPHARELFDLLRVSIWPIVQGGLERG